MDVFKPTGRLCHVLGKRYLEGGERNLFSLSIFAISFGFPNWHLGTWGKGASALKKNKKLFDLFVLFQDKDAKEDIFRETRLPVFLFCSCVCVR